MVNNMRNVQQVDHTKRTARRYWDGRFKRYVVKLLPGEFAVGHKDEIIVTVLGSCITACIYETGLGVGGMNHFMLPFEKYKNRKSINKVTNYKSLTARYGNVAMEMLINEIIKIGGMRYNLIAKIFGGASITDTSVDIGSENISFVREYLTLEDIKIVSEDVGGFLPRKVYYIPDTNDVYIKKIEKANINKIVDNESKSRKIIQNTNQNGKIYFLDD